MTEEYTEQEDAYVDAPRLQNKTIEPENRVSRFANRNLQLGNIDKRLLIFYYHQIDRALKYDKLPVEYGGFLTQDLANNDMETINLQFVASGSANGFVREINATQRKINDNRYSEVRLGKFGRMRKQE
jgi:hypothetical protein